MPRARVHVVLGGADAVAPVLPRPSGLLRLAPGDAGTLTSTRWLTAGASGGTGWPLLAEAEANAAMAPGVPAEASAALDAIHVFLQLASPETGVQALVDELHPLYTRGVPRIATLLQDLRTTLHDRSLAFEPGICFVHLAEPLDPALARKLAAQVAWMRLPLACIDPAPPGGGALLPPCPDDPPTAPLRLPVATGASAEELGRLGQVIGRWVAGAEPVA